MTCSTQLLPSPPRLPSGLDEQKPLPSTPATLAISKLWAAILYNWINSYNKKTSIEDWRDPDILFPPTCYSNQTIPCISLSAYLDRLLKYGLANNNQTSFIDSRPEDLSRLQFKTMIFSILYLDRYFRRHPADKLHMCNVHRLAFISTMIAWKFFNDEYYSNSYYAKVGGISLRECNKLEIFFLFNIDFSLQIDPKKFEANANTILRIFPNIAKYA